jgi:glycosyltransferase involved in cell wall biosynthesis
MTGVQTASHVEKVKLAYLLSCYPKLSEAFISREVRGLRQRGFDIHVASVNDPDLSEDKLTQEDREEAGGTYYIKRHGVRGALTAHVRTALTRPVRYGSGLAYAVRLGGTDVKRCLYGLFYFVESVMLGHWMHKRQVKHVHAHFATPASTVAMIAARIFPITFSITVHGPDEYHLGEKVRAASFVTCIGKYARSQLMKLSSFEHWHKLEIAPLGVDPKLFSPEPFRVKSAPFEILCVGRLVPAKGQHVLVAAVDRLLKSGRQVRLRLVGDGPDRASLEKEVEHREMGTHVVFEGAVTQDRIRTLYAQADAFALASFAEGIPVVLMEAMAMGIPCVSTHITGIPELIRDGTDGLLVAPSDDEGLSEALGRLMDHPALRKRFAETGRRRVLQRYNLDFNVGHLAEILRQRVSAEVSPRHDAQATLRPLQWSPAVATRGKEALS